MMAAAVCMLKLSVRAASILISFPDGDATAWRPWAAARLAFALKAVLGQLQDVHALRRWGRAGQ